MKSFSISFIFKRTCLVKLCPIFDGSSSNCLTIYQKILWRGHGGAKMYFISYASLWNSTAVNTLLTTYYASHPVGWRLTRAWSKLCRELLNYMDYENICYFKTEQDCTKIACLSPVHTASMLCRDQKNSNIANIILIEFALMEDTSTKA